MDESRKLDEVFSFLLEATSERLHKAQRRLSALEMVLIRRGVISDEEIDCCLKELIADEEIHAVTNPQLREANWLLEKFRKLQEYVEQGVTPQEAGRLVNQEFGESLPDFPNLQTGEQ